MLFCMATTLLQISASYHTGLATIQIMAALASARSNKEDLQDWEILNNFLYHSR